jgi:hypothetical protein
MNDKKKITLQDVMSILDEFLVLTIAQSDNIEIATNDDGQILLRVTNTIANGEINVNTGTWNGKTLTEWGLHTITDANGV